MDAAATPERHAEQPPWLEQAAGFMVDLDGTLVRQHSLMPGAIRLLQALGERAVIVSNNSTDVAGALQRKLRALGLPVNAEQLVLAGEETVRWLAHHRGGRRLMLLGSTHLRRLARQMGLDLSDRDPDVVVLARDKSFNYARLARAANHVHQGAELVATNADRRHPGKPPQTVVPETGALLAAVTAASGVAATRVIGKPGPALWHEALRRLGTSPGETLVIGDNPDTDGRGAESLGLPFLLLGTGPEHDAAPPGDLLAFPGPPRRRLSSPFAAAAPDPGFSNA